MLRGRLTSVARAARRAVRSFRIEWRLRRSGDATARAVADGLRRARRSQFDPHSTAWFDRIEELRAELASSVDRVEVIDYGAGLPSMTRTDAEMRSGSVSSAAIAPLSVTASLPPGNGRQLHAIVSAIGAGRGLELGTCLGLSAAYQASALDDGADRSFITCEGAPGLAALAEQHLSRLRLDWARVVVGRFDVTVPSVAADLEPLHYAYIDGHHDEVATQRYFDLLRPHAAHRAVFVFDDIRWSDGMTRAWKTISSSPAVVAAADLGRMGLVVVDGSGAGS